MLTCEGVVVDSFLYFVIAVVEAYDRRRYNGFIERIDAVYVFRGLRVGGGGKVFS